MYLHKFALTLTYSTLLLSLGGCCCCWRGSWPPSNFPTDGTTIDDSGDGTAPAAVGEGDAKEMQDARDYAQKALNAKGYGAVKTANLHKDGLNWYVSGTAAGSDGGEVNYDVWFLVTQFESENQLRQTWAVKTVTVDGEVVYP